MNSPHRQSPTIFRIIHLTLIIVLLFFMSCKKKSPGVTEPNPEETPPGTQEVAGETIGSTGGDVGTSEFLLTVPPGAFGEEVDISLFEEPDTLFGESAVSNMFTLIGIPEDLNEPLEVRIKYSGELSGVYAIAVGREREIFDIDSSFTEVVYDDVNAVVEDGFLVCAIQAQTVNENAAGKAVDDDLSPFSLIALSGGEFVSSSGGHFAAFSFDDASRVEINSRFVLFEKAYDELLQFGFDLTCVNWPTFFTIKRYTTGHKGRVFICSIREIPDREIHLIHDYYISLFLTFIIQRNVCAEIGNTNKWLVRSFNAWLLIAYSDGEIDFVKVIKQTFTEFPLIKNVFPNNPWDEDFYFYSGALLLDYLFVNYGKTFLADCFKLTDSGLDRVEALSSKTDAPEAWIHSFFESLMNDALLTEFLGDFWVTNYNGIFEIHNGFNEDTRTSNYKDLSARWYKITIDSDVDPDADLELTASSSFGGVSPEISVFKIEGNALTPLESGGAAHTISKVANYAGDGTGLLVLVVNPYYEAPYSGLSDVTLKAKLLKEDYPGQANVDFRTQVTMYIDYVDPEREDDPDYVTTIQFLQDVNTIHGIWTQNGTVFNGAVAGGNTVASLHVVRTLACDMITSFTYTENGNNTGSNIVWNLEIEGKNIPIVGDVRYERYAQNGELMCKVLSKLEYERTTSDRTETVTEHACTGASLFDVDMQ